MIYDLLCQKKRFQGLLVDFDLKNDHFLDISDFGLVEKMSYLNL